MIRDPLILVECDVCGETYEYSMTRTGRGWDDRGMERRLEEEGWTVEQEGLHTVCPECVQKEEEEEEEMEVEPEMEEVLPPEDEYPFADHYPELGEVEVDWEGEYD